MRVKKVLPPVIRGQLPSETVGCAALPDMGGLRRLVVSNLKATQVMLSGTANIPGVSYPWISGGAT